MAIMDMLLARLLELFRKAHLLSRRRLRFTCSTVAYLVDPQSVSYRRHLVRLARCEGAGLRLDNSDALASLN